MSSATPVTDDLVRAMAERIALSASCAEALGRLRAAFPESPLALRVAALSLVSARSGEPHIPR